MRLFVEHYELKGHPSTSLLYDTMSDVAIVYRHAWKQP